MHFVHGILEIANEALLATEGRHLYPGEHILSKLHHCIQNNFTEFKVCSWTIQESDFGFNVDENYVEDLV